MKPQPPLLITIQQIRDLIYRMAREWEATVEEIEDPDQAEALTVALAQGYPLGRDLDELAAELDNYAEHVERVLGDLPTVLQLVAAEMTEDVNRVTADLTKEQPDRPVDEAYRTWQTGGLGGEVDRLGGIFTPGVAGNLAALLLAVDGGDPELIQQAADRLGRAYRGARRQSHL